MKKRIIILLLFLFFPVFALAISKDYVDNVADIVGAEQEENKINLYLFHSADCSHCAKEREWLQGMDGRLWQRVQLPGCPAEPSL